MTFIQPTEIQQEKKIDIQTKRMYTHYGSKESHHRKSCIARNKELTQSTRKTYPYVPDDTVIQKNNSYIHELIPTTPELQKYSSVAI